MPSVIAPPVAPAVRKGGIVRGLRNTLEEADRYYWREVGRYINSTGSIDQAINVPYPDLPELQREFETSIAHAWDDSSQRVLYTLQRRGKRLLTFAAKKPSLKDQALELIINGEDIIVPRDAIEQYAKNRIPPLRGSISQERKVTCGQLIQRATSEGLSIRKSSKLLAENGYGNSAWHRETIARTESATLYSHGSVARYRASAAVSGMQFDAVMDERVSDICEELHGKIFAMDDVDGVTPPLHFACRSELIPVLFDEAPEQYDDANAILNKFMDDPNTKNPPPGFGTIDLTGMPIARDPQDLYRPLSQDETHEMRQLWEQIMRSAQQKWGPNWATK